MKKRKITSNNKTYNTVDEQPPFRQFKNKYNPMGRSDETVVLGSLPKVEESFIMDMLYDWLSSDEKKDQIMCLLQLLTKQETHSLITAPYVGLHIMKSDANTNPNKLMQFYNVVNQVEALPNQSSLLVDRFFYEYITMSKERFFDFYLRISHALSFESSLKTKSSHQLRLFCGIFQYLIWNSLKYNSKNHFENKMQVYLTNMTINYLNCAPDDIRLQDFSEWTETNTLNIRDIQEKAWFNLQVIKEIENPPVMYVDVFMSFAILAEYFVTKDDISQFLQLIIHNNSSSTDLLQYCTKLLTDLNDDSFPKYMWMLLDIDPMNSLFDLTFPSENQDFLNRISPSHTLNLVRILFKRLAVFENRNNLADLNLLTTFVENSHNTQAFTAIWNQNSFAWIQFLANSQTFQLNDQSVKLRSQIKCSLEKISP